MQPKLTATYTASTTKSSEPLEIIGEVFDLPIHKNIDGSTMFYTRIRFVTNGFQLSSKTRYFIDQLSKEDLEKNVNHYKDNLKEIF